MIENTKSKAALITGSAIRVGRAIALKLAGNKYDIALHYNSSIEKAKETVNEIRDLGVRCELFQQDLTAVEELKAFVEDVFNSFPRLNVLVNSASHYIQAGISETTPEIFDSQMALNLRAPFFLIKTFCELCDNGNIINIIDNKAAFNQFHFASYLLTKKSLAELTKMAAAEYAPHIRVNGIAPGFILPMTSRTDEYKEWRRKGIPVARTGNVDNITDLMMSIIENDFINGQILFVDGGESITNIGLNAGNFIKKSQT